jgi:eukaryotic-like serine/threonine-protein kinase
MSAPVTSAEFMERVRKSGLCPDVRLDHYLSERGLAADAHAEPISAEMVRAGLLTDYQAKQILSGAQRDFFIASKYRILELLGRGGMGSVFLCEHVRMRRLVAVKVLPQERETDESVLARFEREAQAVAALNHPNIVRAFDIDHVGGRHFLVMEFIDGIDLHSLVAEHGALTPNRAAWCIVQTAHGLHHAWMAGWVHRDIKPGNLLLDRTGAIKILDMGLARIFEAGGSNVTSLFNEGVILGTADFLSPEQAMGNTDTDIRSDIYSLGATFYFLLAGKAPFEDGTVSQKLLYHRTLNPMPIQSRRPDVPDGMAAILDRMMEKDPRKRFETPEELANALLPFCTPAPPPPSAEELLTWGPAVMERMRACQISSDPVAPQTVPLVFKRAPKTELANFVEPDPAPEAEAAAGRSATWIAVPRWLAALVLLSLAALMGWTIYRETHLPVQNGPAVRPSLGQ